MFESLSDKLEGVFKRLSGKGKLTEADVDVALREVRMALLEADVNLKVVRQFLDRVRVRAVGAEVMESLTPAQAVIKIVNEELISTLGEPAKLDISGPAPHVLLLLGLQGAGKTTMAAKLALLLRKQGQRPLLVAADTRRPAAIQQLQTLGKQLDITVFAQDAKVSPPQICVNAVQHAQQNNYSIVILDTAGRLQIDDDLMNELEQVKKRTTPQESLLVVDSMTGQEAVRVADEFNKRIGITGLILTKVDGDARGGAALSVRSVTGVPIKFLGVGEKADALEPFYPDRLASRILGMGDVLTLIERAQQNLDQEQARVAAEKMLKAQFTLQDFLTQMQQLKKMGPLTQIMGMIPGFSQYAKQIPEEATEQQFKRIEAIIHSMTLVERNDPDILNARRRQRIAKGSGTTVQDVNELMREFKQMQKMMQQFGKAGKGGRGMPRIPGFPGM